jgi:hypothetical protein
MEGDLKEYVGEKDPRLKDRSFVEEMEVDSCKIGWKLLSGP